MRRSLAVSLFVFALAACGGGSPNTAPVAVDDQATTAEDTIVTVDVLANDRDPDGDALSITAATADGHDVEVVNGQVQVTPAPDFHGEIRVEVEIEDGEETATSEAVITVTPVNDAPTAGAAAVTTGRNAGLAITLTGEDVDGDDITFELLDAPGHGEITGTAPDLTYTPSLDYVGGDELHFVVRDAAAASAPATVAITVTAGATPFANSISAAMPEDTALDVTLTASDSDGDVLTFAVTEQPAHGTVAGTPPNLTYTPAADFHGADSFSFTATDGVLTSTPAQVLITVTAVNDAPQAVATVATTAEDTSISITLSGTDVDGQTLTYAVAAQPAHGSVVVTGTTALYAPSPNHAGADAFTFTVSDGTATSAPATVSLLVTAVADAPVATAQAAAAVEDQPLAITLGGTDGDGDALTFSVAAAPTHGTLGGTAPNLIYTPAANYHGADSLSFVASDGGLSSAPAAVAITVASVNDAPTAASSAVSALEDQSVTFTLAGADVDGDALTYSILVAPAHGLVGGTGASRTYYPNTNTHGDDQLVYQVSDGQSTASGTITVAVASVNDVPVAHDDIAITTPDTAVTIGVVDNDDDADGDTLTVDVASAPAHGDVEIAGGDVIYTPDAAFTGSDAFTYTIVDGAGGTATATVRVGTGQFPTGVPIAFIAKAIGINASAQWAIQDLSADGRFLAFLSGWALVPDDTNAVADIYVYDRLDGGLERVSVSSAGAQADGACDQPTISADGRRVAFASTATNLVAGDTNTTTDVFVHDRLTGTTTRVSVGPDGAQGSSPSFGPELSASGTVVAFASSAFELVPNDANGVHDVFVRDLDAQTTTRVSVTSAGSEGDAMSYEAALSADGHVVAFRSYATNLVPGDTNNYSDVFVRDLVTGVTQRVSVTSNGVEGNNLSRRPSLSDDGRFVSFLSLATNLTTDAANWGSKVFVRDRQSSTTTWAYPQSSNQMQFAHLSGDGRYLAGNNTDGSCFIRDRFAAVTHVISQANGADVYVPVLSSNGRYVAVVSANGLAPPPPGLLGTMAFVLPNPLGAQ